MTGLVKENVPAFSLRLPHFLRPAYIDEARFIIQAPVFGRMLDGVHLSGACLNAGCGEMMYLNWLDALPGLTHFTHMDLETAPVTAVRGNRRHNAVTGSVTELPFPDGSFQFVFCTEVLEHVLDHHKGAAEISRVLTSGGIALISTPTPPAPFDPNHVREGYRLEEMTQLLEAHGLIVLRHRYVLYFLSRCLYVTWRFLAQLRGNGISALPRFILRGWSHLENAFPIGRPWDIVVVARKKLSTNG
jgi:SAM-dependent methyltransferase